MPPAYADCFLFTKVTAQRSFASKILHRPLNQTHQLIMKEREGEGGREAVGGQRMTQQLIMQVRERDVERRRMVKMSQDSHQVKKLINGSETNKAWLTVHALQYNLETESHCFKRWIHNKMYCYLKYTLKIFLFFKLGSFQQSVWSVEPCRLNQS